LLASPPLPVFHGPSIRKIGAVNFGASPKFKRAADTMKNSVKQKRCGIPALKHHKSEAHRPETAAGAYKFVSATLPSLELRLAAIHAKISGNPHG
jgi:hypothetical protein